MIGPIRFPVVVSLEYDPAADKVVPLWRAPFDCWIQGAWATVATNVAGHTANYFSLQLQNAGTAGAGTATFGIKVGGTPGWSALVPKNLTPNGYKVAAGELVCVAYDENGTGTFGQVTVQLEVTY